MEGTWSFLLSVDSFFSIDLELILRISMSSYFDFHAKYSWLCEAESLPDMSLADRVLLESGRDTRTMSRRTQVALSVKRFSNLYLNFGVKSVIQSVGRSVAQSVCQTSDQLLRSLLSLGSLQ